MKQFSSIEKIDTCILYVLELTSSLSVLLLAFGLIASMANVLTQGSVLTDNLLMQRVWAWTQCIAIDASVAGTIIRTFRYHTQKEHVKCVLYALLSLLLLFTAAIVSNIESVQQTLNLTLEAAYGHVFISVEALIWVRSLVIVLLIVAHAMRHVQQESAHTTPVQVSIPQPTPLVLTPELVDALRAALTHVTVSEEPQPLQALPTPQSEQRTNTEVREGEQETNTEVREGEQETNTAQQAPAGHDHEHETNNFERVKAYLARHPEATDREIAEALTMSTSTANKWRKRVKETTGQSERSEQQASSQLSGERKDRQ
jgi:hypothetical protein